VGLRNPITGIAACWRRAPRRRGRLAAHVDRRRDDATIGIGPGGVTIGPRQHCRTVTTTVQRDDGRTVTRRERRYD